MNELLFFIGIILTFSSVVLIAKLFGCKGLIGWVAVVTILANIIVSKQITLFGLDVTMGNILFSATFLCSDILTEVYGPQFSRKAVLFGVIAEVFFIGATQFTLLFNPNDIDMVNESMKTIFSLTLRITIASIIMYIIGNLSNIYIFESIKKRYPQKLWVRNNISTIISNSLQNIIFNVLAFWGIYDISTCLEIGLGTCVIVSIIGLCDTPFVYLGRKLALKNDKLQN